MPLAVLKEQSHESVEPFLVKNILPGPQNEQATAVLLKFSFHKIFNKKTVVSVNIGYADTW